MFKFSAEEAKRINMRSQNATAFSVAAANHVTAIVSKIDSPLEYFIFITPFLFALHARFLA